MKHIALLRGINVGGKAKLPMKELAAIFRAAGATTVETYIQSGNVIFEASEPESCVDAVTAEIARVYGYPGRIVLRSAEELRRAYQANPFLASPTPSADQPDPRHIYFLADSPEQAAIATLDPNRSLGDSFVTQAREVYLHLPQGMARTRLTNAYFDAKLKTVSTARNWKTVGKLVELSA
jgi:uncharacterized protein (DUF1697 family)